MDFFMKKPGMTVADQRLHQQEYTDYQNSLPGYLKPDEYEQFLEGFFASVGFFRRQPVYWEADNRIFRFPWLDEYWTRAGCVYLTEEDLQRTHLMGLRLRIASCLREALRRGEIDQLIDPAADSNLKNWLRLGGSE